MHSSISHNKHPFYFSSCSKFHQIRGACSLSSDALNAVFPAHPSHSLWKVLAIFKTLLQETLVRIVVIAQVARFSAHFLGVLTDVTPSTHGVIMTPFTRVLAFLRSISCHNTEAGDG